MCDYWMQKSFHDLPPRAVGKSWKLLHQLVIHFSIKQKGGVALDNEFLENYESDLLFFDVLLGVIDARLDALESAVAEIKKVVLSRYDVFILNSDPLDDDLL